MAKRNDNPVKSVFAVPDDTPATLNPNAEIFPYTSAINTFVEDLVKERGDEGYDALLPAALKAVSTNEQEYRSFGLRAITLLLEFIRTTTVRAKTMFEERRRDLADRLTADLKEMLVPQAEILVGARHDLEDAEKNLRRMKIIAFGTPDRDFAVTPWRTVLMIAMTAVTLVPEFFLNFDVNKGMTSPFIARLLSLAIASIGIGLVMILKHYLALILKRRELEARHAQYLTNRLEYRQDGRDRVLGYKVELHPPVTFAWLFAAASAAILVGGASYLVVSRQAFVAHEGLGSEYLLGTYAFVALLAVLTIVELSIDPGIPRDIEREYANAYTKVQYLKDEVKASASLQGKKGVAEKVFPRYREELKALVAEAQHVNADASNAYTLAAQLIRQYGEATPYWQNEARRIARKLYVATTEGRGVAAGESWNNAVDDAYEAIRSHVGVPPTAPDQPSAIVIEPLDFQALANETWKNAIQLAEEARKITESGRQKANVEYIAPAIDITKGRNQ